MADGNGLENRRSASYRGFESHSLRQLTSVYSWGGAGVVDRGRLLSGCGDTNLHPGFESLPPRLFRPRGSIG